MGGGFPAAAFGGRADVMAQLAPVGPGLPGGHAVREPGRDGRRADHAAAGDRRRLRPPRPDRRRRSREARARRARRGRRAALVQAAGNLFSVFFVDEDVTPVRDFDDASAPGTSRATRPSSTRCSTSGVYLPPSAFEAWFVSAAHDDRAARPDRSRRCPRPPAQPRPSPTADSRTPMTASSTIVHLLRHGEVHNPDGSSTAGCPASTCPPLGRQMAERVADSVGDRDIVHLVSLAARAGPGDGARRSPRRSAAEVVDRRAGHRGRQHVRGPAVRRRRRRRCGTRRPGGTCCNPFRPSWGEPYTEIAARMLRRDARRPRRGAAGTRPSSSPTSCRSGSPGCTPSAGGCARPAQARSARWQPDLVHVRGRPARRRCATPSRPPTCPGQGPQGAFSSGGEPPDEAPPA